MYIVGLSYAGNSGSLANRCPRMCRWRDWLAAEPEANVCIGATKRSVKITRRAHMSLLPPQIDLLLDLVPMKRHESVQHRYCSCIFCRREYLLSHNEETQQFAKSIQMQYLRSIFATVESKSMPNASVMKCRLDNASMAVSASCLYIASCN